MDLAALLNLGNRDGDSPAAKEPEEAAEKARLSVHLEPRSPDLHGRDTVEEKTEQR